MSEPLIRIPEAEIVGEPTNAELIARVEQAQAVLVRIGCAGSSQTANDNDLWFKVVNDLCEAAPVLAQRLKESERLAELKDSAHDNLNSYIEGENVRLRSP